MKCAVPLLLLLLAAQAGAQPAAPEAEQSLRALLRSEARALEHGEGTDRDPERAAALYCRAARLGDTESQIALGWMYANGRGVERSDGTAAFFFQAAAEQGHAQAQRMLAVVGGPTTEVPDCLREPAPPVPAVAATPRARLPQVAAVTPPPLSLARFAGPPHLLTLAQRTAAELGVPAALVLAIVQAESNFNVAAQSPKNARGLMQLIPDTAARFGVRDPWDAAQNLRGGTAYLRWLLAYFEGDVALAAAGYNAGEGAVDRYRGIPPYTETRAYVRKVLDLCGLQRVPFDPAASRPSPQLQAIREPRRAT